MQYIDLTQTFTSDMPVYPGDILPELKQVATIEQGGSTDHRINTGMHVGTHVDAPLHMIAGGKKISEIEVEKFFGPGKLIDARGQEKIGPNFLTEVRAGDIVLVLTGFGAKFRDSDYYDKHPELTNEFCQKLVELKVKMVGMDMPSPDRAPYEAHKILLGAEILILENLTNLEQLLNKQFEVVALPAKFATNAAPVRVIAKIK